MLSASSKVRVRRAKLSDATVLSETFRSSWALAYRGIIPHLHLESIIRRRGVAWWRNSIRGEETILVLEVSGKVAGYATCGIARSKRQQRGEIYELYLAPVYQGLGFGEHLFEACRASLDQMNVNGLVVWALAANDGAIAFYWKRGGRPIAVTRERFGTTRLEKIAFTWD